MELIRYNKRLQKKNNISLINYKFFSGRYIIYETKTKGKEYNVDDNTLIYEGEYKNGEKSGKGKEYYDMDKLLFEGEYLNRLKNGKGKAYSPLSTKVEYEGEFIDGIRNGKAKEYDFINGNLKFEGEYINGDKLNGKGYNGLNNKDEFSFLLYTIPFQALPFKHSPSNTKFLLSSKSILFPFHFFPFKYSPSNSNSPLS